MIRPIRASNWHSVAWIELNGVAEATAVAAAAAAAAAAFSRPRLLGKLSDVPRLTSLAATSVQPRQSSLEAINSAVQWYVQPVNWRSYQVAPYDSTELTPTSGGLLREQERGPRPRALAIGCRVQTRSSTCGLQ